ncbi:hypothetical protein AB0M54_38620 [Actinoplanes sp. NPDC051470]|uniref:hypothetical protein n=1 Tax=Actinoplanes sp. NPDC051470 TaxID=3157224 RepID=UPI00341B3AD3
MPLDISAGCYEAGEWIVQPDEVDRGVLAPYATMFRVFGKPVGVAGRIVTGDTAEEILASGAADFVAVGRALHADPGWTAATLAGVLPRPCIGCNQGCIDVLHTQQPIWCLVNPGAGREALRGAGREALRGAGRDASPGRRRVLVAGAGVAGRASSTCVTGYGTRIHHDRTASSRSGEPTAPESPRPTPPRPPVTGCCFSRPARSSRPRPDHGRRA